MPRQAWMLIIRCLILDSAATFGVLVNGHPFLCDETSVISLAGISLLRPNELHNTEGLSGLAEPDVRQSIQVEDV